MDDHINQFFDIIIMIVMLAFGCSLLATSYHIIDAKVDKEVRDDKTAIRNYTGVTLDSNPEATFEYTSEEVLLMAAIQDMYVPSTRSIRIGAKKDYSTILDSHYSATNTVGEDMYGSNYLRNHNDRKLFLQKIYSPRIDIKAPTGLWLDTDNHVYKTTETSGCRYVSNLKESLKLTSNPPKWVLRMKTDDIAINEDLTRNDGSGKDTSLNTGPITPNTKAYFWCFINK